VFETDQTRVYILKSSWCTVVNDTLDFVCTHTHMNTRSCAHTMFECNVCVACLCASLVDIHCKRYLVVDTFQPKKFSCVSLVIILTSIF
jgi:hypothetical protein